MERSVASDVAEVTALWNRYVAACHRGDFELWLSLWADDCIQLAPDAPPRIGIDQLRVAWQHSFDHFNMSGIVIDLEETRILGDWAYCYSTYTIDLASKERGEAKTLCGKYLDILKKQADGSWKIAIDCHNYNKP